MRQGWGKASYVIAIGWLCKHDGFRLIVQRYAERVRPFTRNGHNWTAIYGSWTPPAGFDPSNW